MVVYITVCSFIYALNKFGSTFILTWPHCYNLMFALICPEKQIIYIKMDKMCCLFSTNLLNEFHTMNYHLIDYGLVFNKINNNKKWSGHKDDLDLHSEISFYYYYFFLINCIYFCPVFEAQSRAACLLRPHHTAPFRVTLALSYLSWLTL